MEAKQYVYVRRLEDGKVLDMEKKQWIEIQRDSQRSKQFEFVSEISIGGQDELPPIVEEPIELTQLRCECGYEAKTERGLQVHKGRSHK